MNLTLVFDRDAKLINLAEEHMNVLKEDRFTFTFHPTSNSIPIHFFFLSRTEKKKTFLIPPPYVD